MSNRTPGRDAIGLTILLVEPDQLLASNLQAMLIESGYAVRVTATAEDALATFEPSTYDAVLMNLTLPDSDGLILCSSLRALGSTPVLLMSDRPRPVDRVLAFELGATDFLATSVDLDWLERLAAAIVGTSGPALAASGAR